MFSKPTKIAGATALAAAAVVLAMSGCARVSTTGPSATSSSSDNAAIPGITSDARLPSDWPSDVPVPPLPVKNAVSINTPSGPTYTVVFQGEGDPGTLFTALNEQFRTAGFASQSSFGSGPAGGVAVWSKGAVRVQIFVATQDGKVVVSENVMIDKGKS